MMHQQTTEDLQDLLEEALLLLRAPVRVLLLSPLLLISVPGQPQDHNLRWVMLEPISNLHEVAPGSITGFHTMHSNPHPTIGRPNDSEVNEADAGIELLSDRDLLARSQLYCQLPHDETCDWPGERKHKLGEGVASGRVVTEVIGQGVMRAGQAEAWQGQVTNLH